MGDAPAFALLVGWLVVGAAALWAMVGGVVSSYESRSERIFNCFCVASAFAVLCATGVLKEVIDAGVWARPGAWVGMLLLASCFVYGLVLEVASWFSR